MSTDPLRAVRQALERLDCNPTGPNYKLTARCPAHEDRDPSLSIGEGIDGRVVMHCHAGCDTANIVRALGLQWPDLFPMNHRNGRPHKILAKPRPAIDLVLDALRELEIDYRATASPDFFVVEQCPACERAETFIPGQAAPGPLWIQRDAERVRLSCMHGCSQSSVFDALVGAEESS